MQKARSPPGSVPEQAGLLFGQRGIKQGLRFPQVVRRGGA